MPSQLSALMHWHTLKLHFMIMWVLIINSLRGGWTHTHTYKHTHIHVMAHMHGRNTCMQGHITHMHTHMQWHTCCKNTHTHTHTYKVTHTCKGTHTCKDIHACKDKHTCRDSHTNTDFNFPDNSIFQVTRHASAVGQNVPGSNYWYMYIHWIIKYFHIITRNWWLH